MAGSIYIDFPVRDVEALQRQMRRFAHETGKDMAEALKFAAWAVAGALSAATKVSAKYRPYKEDKTLKYQGGVKKFSVEKYRKDGSRKMMTVFANSVSDLKKDPRVRIGRRGLAKSAWFFAEKRFGRSSGDGGATANARRLGERLMRTEQQLRGLEPHIKITDRVKYAAKAFKSGGEQTVSNAMERAHKRMEHIIDNKMAKRLGVTLWK
jgi:hypothetical protein